MDAFSICCMFIIVTVMGYTVNTQMSIPQSQINQYPSSYPNNYPNYFPKSNPPLPPSLPSFPYFPINPSYPSSTTRNYGLFRRLDGGIEACPAGGAVCAKGAPNPCITTDGRTARYRRCNGCQDFMVVTDPINGDREAVCASNPSNPFSPSSPPAKLYGPFKRLDGSTEPCPEGGPYCLKLGPKPCITTDGAYARYRRCNGCQDFMVVTDPINGDREAVCASNPSYPSYPFSPSSPPAKSYGPFKRLDGGTEPCSFGVVCDKEVPGPCMTTDGAYARYRRCNGCQDFMVVFDPINGDREAVCASSPTMFGYN